MIRSISASLLKEQEVREETPSDPLEYDEEAPGEVWGIISLQNGSIRSQNQKKVCSKINFEAPKMQFLPFTNTWFCSGCSSGCAEQYCGYQYYRPQASEPRERGGADELLAEMLRASLHCRLRPVLRNWLNKFFDSNFDEHFQFCEQHQNTALNNKILMLFTKCSSKFVFTRYRKFDPVRCESG